MSNNELCLKTEEELIGHFRPLHAWTTEPRFHPQSWKRYIEVARIVQNTDSALVEFALHRFITEAVRAKQLNDQDESKVFLLMRVVFDLPRSAPVEKRFSFKGWVNWPDPDENNRVNLGWPILWTDEGPRLLAGYEGSMGLPYAACRIPRRIDDSINRKVPLHE